MRNIIAHEYGNVDYEIVWSVVTGEPFRTLRANLAAITADLPTQLTPPPATPE